MAITLLPRVYHPAVLTAGTFEITGTAGLHIDASSSVDDVKVTFAIAGSDKFVTGIDNSVSGDPYVFSRGATLGTNNVYSIDGSTGAITILTATVLNGALSGTSFKDQDDMSSNSATSVASQQSIKAYVDAQVTAQDLDLTSDSGTIDVDLDSETLSILGGTGLDSSATGTAVTLAIDSSVVTLSGTQTLTGKTLTTPIIGSFAEANHDHSNDAGGANIGVVTGTSGTLTVARGGTGATSLTDGGVVLGSGTNAVSVMTRLADSEMIVGQSSGDPVIESGATLRDSIGVGTGNSPQFTGLEIGHADDTTVTRVSAGDLQIQTNIIYRAGGTDVAVADGGTGQSNLNNLITLGTHSTGNYVATVADSGGGGITVANSGSEGAAVTLELDINGLTTDSIHHADFIPFSDEDEAGDPTNKITLANLVAYMDGVGLSATNGVLAIDATVATLAGSQTFTNKVLTSPTITAPSIGADQWSSANHGHQVQNQGGALDVAAITSGTLSLARGGTGQTTANAFGATITTLGAQTQTLDMNDNTIIDVGNASNDWLAAGLTTQGYVRTKHDGSSNLQPATSTYPLILSNDTNGSASFSVYKDAYLQVGTGGGTGYFYSYYGSTLYQRQYWGTDAEGTAGMINYLANTTDKGFAFTGWDGDSWEQTLTINTGTTRNLDMLDHNINNAGVVNVDGLTMDSVALTTIQTGSESFADNDTSVMTSAAVQDKILSYGYATATGDIEGVTAGVGLSGGGTSGTVTVTLDMSELPDMTAGVNSAQDELILLDNGADHRKLISEIGLSAFSNDSGFTTNTGDITGVTAGTGLSGGGSSGTVSLAVDLSELSDVAIANGDYIIYTDATDSNITKKDAVHDLATLFAGSGLTATNSVIAVDTLNQNTSGTAAGLSATLAVSSGGTGATTLNDLITLSTHTTGNYVATITGGTGISSSAGTSGEGTTHTLTNTGVTSIVAGSNISISGATGAVTVTGTNTWRDIDDTAVNGVTDQSISSNWAYDHAASVTAGAHSQQNFTTTLKNKLDGIAASATNVTNNNQITNGAGYITSYTDTNTWRGIDDTPVNGQTAESITSNWAYDHAASVTAGAHSQQNFTTTLKNKLDGVASSANNYSHPSYNGDDFSVDTTHLSGAYVVDDIDINVTTDALGHVTDANGTVATRQLTYGDIGAAASSHGTHIGNNTIDSDHYVDGSIDTVHIADNQITLAKMASGTDGNIISYDASGNPVAIATGSDGQVLTSAGTGQPPAFEDAAGGFSGFADGSEGSPGAYFTSDTDVGIRRVTTNEMAFVTDGDDAIQINPNGLMSNTSSGGTILGAYQYTQLNAGQNTAHRIRSSLGNIFMDDTASNISALITVQGWGTGSSNAYCQYFYHSNSDENNYSLSHVRGNSGSSSNRPYMNLSGKYPRWLMNHAGAYPVSITVQVYGGNEAVYYRNGGNEFGA